MAPQGQGLVWSEVLCCPICTQIFNEERHAVNLACSHAVCIPCLEKFDEHQCPLDQLEGDTPLLILPTNHALMSILGVHTDGLPSYGRDTDDMDEDDRDILPVIDECLRTLASYLRRAESERGGSVWSEVLSRTVQRKVVSLLCIQLVEPYGKAKAIRMAKGIAERVLSELLQASQSSSSVSSQLWTAVRARGCQFLGPAMQEDVLKLILLALNKGALIARKTLVLYVVQTMTEDYPQVSKTCVGHVVQLLYRASCFNVLKRDAESSLMQLKEEYRSYDALRKEHDTQIVSMAIEVGLRIQPEQWSALLYGDQTHRSHMQSIIDRLITPQSFVMGIDDLSRSMGADNDRLVRDICPLLRKFEHFPSCPDLEVTWCELGDCLHALRSVVVQYAEIIIKRNESRSALINNAVRDGRGRSIGNAAMAEGRGGVFFKTKMCRDAFNRSCPRGGRCTYAHDPSELRPDPSSGTMAPVPGTYNVAPPPPQQMYVMRGTDRRMSLSMPMPPPAPPHGRLTPPGAQFIPMASKRSMPAMGGPLPSMMAGPSAPLPQTVVPPPSYPLPPMGGPGPPPPPVMVQPGFHPVVMVGDPTVGAAAAPGAPISQPMMMMQSSPVMIPVWNPHQPPQHTPPHVSWLPHSDGPCMEGGMFWSKSPPSMSKPPHVGVMTGRSELSEAEQLHMRRNEIIHRLGPLSSLDKDDDGENDDAHVSYTVASSVLDDRMGDLMIGASAMIELPPMPPGYTPLINSTTTSEETFGVISELALDDALATSLIMRAASAMSTNTTTVRTVCPAYSFVSSDSCAPTIVQSDSTTMKVMDTISEPLATPIIVPTAAAVNGTYQPLPAAYPFQPTIAVSVAHDVMVMDAARLPMVIQPLSCITPAGTQSDDPQEVVANTLDRLVDVREKMTEVDGSVSTVVKTQLEVELEIASRQMEQLNPLTTQNCLLKELEAVDRKIEEMGQSYGAVVPTTTTVTTTAC